MSPVIADKGAFKKVFGRVGVLSLAALASVANCADMTNTSIAASFPVNVYAALGESFAAGPSAGDAYEDPNPCRRFTKAFGPQVNADPSLQGASDRKFDFIACSGSVTSSIYASNGTNNSSQAGQLRGTNPDLVTMSIGGNDVGFANILDRCIYRFMDPFCLGNKDDCDNALRDSQASIDDQVLNTGLDSAIRAIFQNAPNTHLYLTIYPHFFNVDTPRCDSIQFTAWCSGSRSTLINPLTRDLRRKLNTLMYNLNNRIKAAVDRARPGTGGAIDWVDPNPYFDGHRFCEAGVEEPSLRNSNIYFYPFEFRKGSTLSYLQSFKNDTDCASIISSRGSRDWGEYYSCETAKALKNSSSSAQDWLNTIDAPSAAEDDEIGADSSLDLPDWAARIFHPTINGMTAYKQAIIDHYHQNNAVASTPTQNPPPNLTSSSSSSPSSPLVERKCTLHLIQTADKPTGDPDWSGNVPDLPAEYTVEITVFDSDKKDKKQIGHQQATAAGDKNPLNISIEGSKDTFVVQPEEQNDYIQFFLGSQQWKSSEKDRCKQGSWDPRSKYPQTRQMDCNFIC